MCLCVFCQLYFLETWNCSDSPAKQKWIHKDTIEVFLLPSDSKVTNFHQLPVWEVHKLELSGIYNSQMSLFEAVGLQKIGPGSAWSKGRWEKIGNLCGIPICGWILHLVLFNLRKKICWLSSGCNIHSCFSNTFEATAVTTEQLAAVYDSLTQIEAGWGSDFKLGGILNSLHWQLCFFCPSTFFVTTRRTFFSKELTRGHPSQELSSVICCEESTDVLRHLLPTWTPQQTYHLASRPRRFSRRSFTFIHDTSLLKFFVGCRILASTTWQKIDPLSRVVWRITEYSPFFGIKKSDVEQRSLAGLTSSLLPRNSRMPLLRQGINSRGFKAQRRKLQIGATWPTWCKAEASHSMSYPYIPRVLCQIYCLVDWES